MGVFRDLTGERYGKLVVVELVERKKRRGTTWRLLCDCGGYVTRTASELGGARKDGNVSSCPECRSYGHCARTGAQLANVRRYNYAVTFDTYGTLYGSDDAVFEDEIRDEVALAIGYFPDVALSRRDASVDPGYWPDRRAPLSERISAIHEDQ